MSREQYHRLSRRRFLGSRHHCGQLSVSAFCRRPPHGVPAPLSFSSKRTMLGVTSIEVTPLIGHGRCKSRCPQFRCIPQSAVQHSPKPWTGAASKCSHLFKGLHWNSSDREEAPGSSSSLIVLPARFIHCYYERCLFCTSRRVCLNQSSTPIQGLRHASATLFYRAFQLGMRSDVKDMHQAESAGIESMREALGDRRPAMKKKIE